MFHIIINPETASGRGIKAWKELKPLFDSAEMEYKLYISSEKNEFGKICQKLTSRLSGSDYINIIVIGGDGSMNEAVNNIKNFERTRLAFISTGSANDLSKALCDYKDKDELIKAIAENRVRRSVDIGVMQAEGVKRLFNISSGIGFDAEICETANRVRLKHFLNKIHLGKLVYILVAINLILKNKKFPCRITYDGNTDKVYDNCLFAVAMNTAYEGGGFKFCPDAVDTDGMLDLCIADGISSARFFLLFPMAYKGKHAGKKGINTEHARKVRLRTDRPVWVHTDGEVSFMSDDITISLYPEKLNLLM